MYVENLLLSIFFKIINMTFKVSVGYILTRYPKEMFESRRFTKSVEVSTENTG